MNDVYRFESVQPSYDKKTKHYILKFKSPRTPLPSINNTILADGGQNVGFKFYKVKENEFFL